MKHDVSIFFYVEVMLGSSKPSSEFCQKLNAMEKYDSSHTWKCDSVFALCFAFLCFCSLDKLNNCRNLAKDQGKV